MATTFLSGRFYNTPDSLGPFTLDTSQSSWNLLLTAQIAYLPHSDQGTAYAMFMLASSQGQDYPPAPGYEIVYDSVTTTPASYTNIPPGAWYIGCHCYFINNRPDNQNWQDRSTWLSVPNVTGYVTLSA
ncbi:MAG: hypothetical protein ABSE69_14075 [Roseiarcus sp.]|jgi:hypothetical protein